MILLAFASVLLLGWSWFLDKKRRLFWLVLAVALVQALVSGGLYFLSIHPPELLKSKVLGPGFWVPFADAKNYFFQSQAWIFFGTPNPGQHPPSSLYVALLGLTGLGSPQPFLAALSLNGLVHLFLLPLTYFFLRGWGEASARWASAGFGCLPSSLIYGSQLLRDPLICLLLFVVVGSLLLLDSGSVGNKRWFLGLSLVLGMAVLTEMRSWVGFACGFTALFATRLSRKKIRLTSKLGLALAFWLGIFLGQQQPASRILMGFPQFESPFCKAGAPQGNDTKSGGPIVSPKKTSLIWSPSFANDQIFSQAWGRIGEKVRETFSKPPVFFATLLLADVFFLLGWTRFFKKKQEVENEIKHAPPVFSVFFLAVLIPCLIGISLVFADTIGNAARYLSPSMLLFMLLIFFKIKKIFLPQRSRPKYNKLVPTNKIMIKKQIKSWVGQYGYDQPNFGKSQK